MSQSQRCLGTWTPASPGLDVQRSLELTLALNARLRSMCGGESEKRRKPQSGGIRLVPEETPGVGVGGEGWRGGGGQQGQGPGESWCPDQHRGLRLARRAL